MFFIFVIYYDAYFCSLLKRITIYLVYFDCCMWEGTIGISISGYDFSFADGGGEGTREKGRMERIFYFQVNPFSIFMFLAMSFSPVGTRMSKPSGAIIHSISWPLARSQCHNRSSKESRRYRKRLMKWILGKMVDDFRGLAVSMQLTPLPVSAISHCLKSERNEASNQCYSWEFSTFLYTLDDAWCAERWKSSTRSLLIS